MSEDEDRQFRSAYWIVKRKNPDAPPEVLEQLITDHIALRKKRLQERDEINAMRKRVNARTRDRQGVFDGTDDKPKKKPGVMSKLRKHYEENYIGFDRTDELDVDIEFTKEDREENFQYWKSELPGAWLTVEAMGNRLNAAMKRKKFYEIMDWHKENGSLDTLKDTYRGDFYEPIKGSPEAKLYWGDFAPDVIKNPLSGTRSVAQMLQYEIANEVSRFDHDNKKLSAFDWIYVKHFAMKIVKSGLQIDTDIGSFILDEFDYVTSVENDWNTFVETLKHHEGNDVWLCFVRGKNRELIDIHLHNNWDRIQDQWKKTNYEKEKTADAYTSVIENRKAEFVKVTNDIQRLHIEMEKLDQAMSEKRKQAEIINVQIEADEAAQQSALLDAEKAHLDNLDKISSFMKKVQEKQGQDDPGPIRAKPLNKPTEAMKVKIPVEVRHPNPNKPDQTNENELLRAKLEASEAKNRANEAEKRELVNKDRVMTMVRGIKEWAAKTEEEKDLMFQAMVNEDIKQLTDEEKKKFHSDAEKLRAKLANQKEPFLVTLPTPHQPEMLALRGGIEHKGSKLLIQIEEWGRGNTCLVTLPDYNVRLLACLATDRKNKTAIAAITFKHPDENKWKPIQDEVTGEMAKFQPGIPIQQYLSWNKEINDRLWIANQQMSA